MLPDSLGEYIARLRQVVTGDEGAAMKQAILIKMDAESLALSIERDRVIYRQITETRRACTALVLAGSDDRAYLRGQAVKAINRLERVLVNAKPSRTSVRRGTAW